VTTLAMWGVGFLLFAAPALAQTAKPTWLDRPMSNWNVPGRAMPRAVINQETIAEIVKRCASLTMTRNTPAERAVADAGWLPFHMFERQIVQRDVEVIGGLAGADGMCRPVAFNVFVFVGGQLAGALAPSEMASRTDGSIGGGIRLSDSDIVSADFARYAESDALCCPSDRVTVRYRIDRTATPPVLVPAGVQPTRR
jgi:hypothetical protein